MSETNEKGIQPRGFMNPVSVKEGMELATWIAKSDLAPRDYKDKPQNVLIAMQMGAEVGLSPMQAIQNIAVVNGRPSIWGDAMLALVQNHRDFETINENESTNDKGVCIVKRRGMEPQRREFTIDDAKKAGLWGKQGPWTTAPARMLKLRARAFALRDTFADALRGLQSAEEERDVVDTTATVEPVMVPKRASETAMTDRAGTNGVSVKLESVHPSPPAAPAPTVPTQKCITLNQAKAFFTAARANGKSEETVRAYIESLGYKGSLEVPESRYAEILAWAEGSPAVGIELETPGIGE